MVAQRQSFLSGAAVLSGAVAATKVLGAMYKIPLGNLLGSEGMAHFYGAYNVFNVLVMVTAGLPVAVSRTVSQNNALGRLKGARRVLSVASGLLFTIGMILGGFMLVLARPLASFIQDPEAVCAIRALAPALTTMCLCGAMRGYTQGLGDMRPTAISEIWESLGKLLVGLGAVYLLLHRGASPAVAAAGALTGVSAGGVFALLYLWRKKKEEPTDTIRGDFLTEAKKLLVTAIPITLSASGMSILTVMDQAVVLRMLRRFLHYSSQQAVCAYGEYTFGMTLFVLGPSLLMPLSAALLPAVSGALAAGEKHRGATLAGSALRLTATLAVPLGVVMSTMAPAILELLYPRQLQAAQAAVYHLEILGIAAVFVSLSAVCGGVLQAYGKPLVPLWALVVGGTAKLLCDVLFVPRLGIRAVAPGTLVCYGLMTLTELLEILRLGARPKGLLWTFFSGAVMTVFIGAFWHRLPETVPVFYRLVCTGAAGCLVYAIIMLLLGGITRRELRWLQKRVRSCGRYER